MAPGSDVRAGRALAVTSGLNPLVSLVGKLRHRDGSQELMAATVALYFPMMCRVSYQTPVTSSETFRDRSSTEGHVVLVSSKSGCLVSPVALVTLRNEVFVFVSSSARC